MELPTPGADMLRPMGVPTRILKATQAETSGQRRPSWRLAVTPLGGRFSTWVELVEVVMFKLAQPESCDILQQEP